MPVPRAVTRISLGPSFSLIYAILDRHRRLPLDDPLDGCCDGFCDGLGDGPFDGPFDGPAGLKRGLGER